MFIEESVFYRLLRSGHDLVREHEIVVIEYMPDEIVDIEIDKIWRDIGNILIQMHGLN